MLVLNRKSNESIIIDGDIKIKVIHIGRGHVTIGIEAPGYIGVYREELLSAMKDNLYRAKAQVLKEA